MFDGVIVVEGMLDDIAFEGAIDLFVDVGVLVFRHNEADDEHDGQTHERCHRLFHSVLTVLHKLLNEAFLGCFVSMFWGVFPIFLLLIFSFSFDGSRFRNILSVISKTNILVLFRNNFDVNILLLKE